MDRGGTVEVADMVTLGSYKSREQFLSDRRPDLGIAEPPDRSIIEEMYKTKPDPKADPRHSNNRHPR